MGRGGEEGGAVVLGENLKLREMFVLEDVKKARGEVVGDGMGG